MSNLNIDQIQLLVIKDGEKIYPSGCTEDVSCNHQMVGIENILTANYVPPIENDCLNGFEAAGTKASDATNATQVVCAKLLVTGRGFVFVDNANYQANIVNCNACC